MGEMKYLKPVYFTKLASFELTNARKGKSIITGGFIISYRKMKNQYFVYFLLRVITILLDKLKPMIS